MDHMRLVIGIILSLFPVLVQVSFYLFVGGVFALNISRLVFAIQTKVNPLKTNFDE